MKRNMIHSELDENGYLMQELPAEEYLRFYRRQPFSRRRRFALATNAACLRVWDLFRTQGIWLLLVIGAFLLAVTLGQFTLRTLSSALAMNLSTDMVQGFGAALGFLSWAVTLGAYSVAAARHAASHDVYEASSDARQQNALPLASQSAPDLNPVSSRVR